MDATKKLSFADVKKKIGEHLKTAINTEEFTIIFAKQEEEVWKVNVEFKERPESIFPTIAMFMIDATTGEVKHFERDRVWRF